MIEVLGTRWNFCVPTTRSNPATVDRFVATVLHHAALDADNQIGVLALAVMWPAADGLLLGLVTDATVFSGTSASSSRSTI